MMTHLRFIPIAVVLLAVALTGCRTYGDYGSADKTIDKISKANEAFARAHERAQTNADALRRASISSEALKPYAEEYDSIVTEHRRMVEEHSQAFGELSGRVFLYSAANRLLGAIVSEQNMIENRYAEVAREAASAVGLESSDHPRPPYSYGLVPPYFERIRYSVGSRGLDDVLRQKG